MKTQNNILSLPAPKTITMPVGEITAEQIRHICGVIKLREFAVEPSLQKSRAWMRETLVSI